MCKKSYVDPRVVDLFHDGVTVELPSSRGRSSRSLQAAVEREVLRLLRD